MPKIIHILRKFEPAAWGGIETHLVGLIPELARLGFWSEVHAPEEAGTCGDALTAAGATFRTFRAYYPYLRMGPKERAALVAAGGNLVSVGELARLLASRGAAAFHVHTLGRLGGVVRTAARLTRTPYAVTLHGPVRANAGLVDEDARRRTRGLVDLGAPFGWAVGARRVVKDADLVFTLNRAEFAAWADERGPRHLELVYHGVDAARCTADERVAARSAVPGLGGAPFYAIVARLDRCKGQDVAMAAFARAAPKGTHLVVVGAPIDPAFTAALRARAEAIGTHIHVVGGVSPRLARGLLAEAEIALIPSRSEPFGIVLLEAWAEGTLALFSNVDGLADIARDTHAPFGAVADPTEEAWASAIRRVLADPEGCRRERHAAADRVTRRYTWRALAERTVAAYRAAGGSRGG